MPLLDAFFESTTLPPARSYVDRCARVCYTAPYMRSIVESVVGSGLFDRIYPLGLAAPNAAVTPSAGGAGVLTGTYGYYTAFVDVARDVIGAPSVASGTVTVAAKEITVSLLPIGNRHQIERATHINIYRNLTGTSTYFFVAQVPKDTLSYTDNSSDAAISANDELPINNAAPANTTYGFVATHKNFPFMLGPYNQTGNTDYDDDFIWGNLSEPDNWPLVNRTKADRGRGGRITCAGSNGDDFVIYKEHSIYVLQFDLNPSGTTGDGYGKTVNTERGCLNGSCFVNVQGTHYLLDQEGIYEHKGFGNIQELARMPLNDIWERINWAQKHKFCGSWDDACCVWFVALDSDTECNWALAFDLKAYRARGEIRWDVKRMNNGIRHCCRMRFGSDSRAVRYGMVNKTAIAVLDTYGYTGYMNAGFRDFNDPQLTGQAVVTSSADTTHITASAATFSRVNEAGDTCSAIGCYGRFLNWEEFASDKPNSEDWSQVYRVTGVSGATLTISPAMPVAATADMIFEIGTIDAVVRSRREDFGAPQVEKKAKRLIAEYQRGGINFTGKIRWRRDQRGYSVNTATVSTESQIAQVAGRDYTTFNMGGAIDSGGQGVVALGAPAGPFRYIEYELDLGGIDQPAIIDALTLEPAE